MEKDILIRYKGQPLEDAVRAKRSNDNANTLEAPKAIYTLTIK